MNFNILSFLIVCSKEERAKETEQWRKRREKNDINQMQIKESVLSSIKVRDKVKVWDCDPDLEIILIQEKSSANSD